MGMDVIYLFLIQEMNISLEIHVAYDAGTRDNFDLDYLR